MISFNDELRAIFGNKYVGCTQAGEDLVEYKLESGKTATPDELAQIEALPKGVNARLAKIEAKLVEIDALKAQVAVLKSTMKIV